LADRSNVQARWLRECLEQNRQTEYGRRWGFSQIDSIASYQARVPLVDYADIETQILRIWEGAVDVLFQGQPVAFECTGGSRGGAKRIPYTLESLEDFQKAVVPYLAWLHENYGVEPSNSYWAISPIVREERLSPAGIPVGVSDEQYLGLQKQEGVVPEWVAQINQVQSWKIATLYWLIRAEKLRFISVWSPTFLLMLFACIFTCRETLGALLETGGTLWGKTLPADRAANKRLDAFVRQQDAAVLWPELQLVSLWQDGLSAPYADALKTFFPAIPFQPKGLISTESVVTMPDEEGVPLLAVQSGFFEFMNAEGIFLYDALKTDQTYEVIVTTRGGLYRYRTGDVVRCYGYKNGRPILRFQYREGIVSDMVGEKLTEAFVAKTLEDVAEFAMLVPDREARRYVLVLASGSRVDVRQIEQRLLRNPQYRYARELGQLHTLQAVYVDNALERYLASRNKAGQRMGDIKVPRLSTDETGWW